MKKQEKPVSRTSKNFRLPTYRLHKPSGRAVVTIDGKDHYLGEFGTAESRVNYQQLVSAERAEDAGHTISDMVSAFWPHALQYFKQSGAHEIYARPLRVLESLYGDTPANDFTPTKLKAVRAQIANEPALCGRLRPGMKPLRTKQRKRYTINFQIRKLREVFKWAAENEFVSAEMFHGLRTVAELARGRTDAPESEPVKPVDDATLEAVLPFMMPRARAIVRLHRLTGMRPGELLSMRGREIDQSGAVWLYRPAHHKNSYRGQDRTIRLGPQAQAILKPYLRSNADAYLWNGREMHNEAARTERGPCYRVDNPKRERRPRKSRAVSWCRIGKGSDCFREHFVAYGGMIRRACDAADAAAHAARPDVPAEQRLVPRFTPHQIRHATATAIAIAFGQDAAAEVLGHSNTYTTARYITPPATLADDAMIAIG